MKHFVEFCISCRRQICQIKTERKIILEELCFKKDKDTTINAPSLAMVYSPKQEWGETYEVNVALERGTLFPELDKPFLGYLKEDIRGR